LTLLGDWDSPSAMMALVLQKWRKTMTIRDLESAVAFLRRLSVGQMEADLLIQTVEALEHEIQKRRKK
jgi:hypothetical protein